MTQKVLLCNNPNYKTKDSYDLIIYWESFEHKEGVISVPKIIESNEHMLKKEYMSWLFGLGEKVIFYKSIESHLSVRDDFSLLWMTSLIEKSHWKTPSIYDAFRLLVLEDLLSEFSVKEININIDNNNVVKSIKEFCTQKKIIVNVLNSNKNFTFSKKYLIDKTPHAVKAVLFLVNYILQCLPIKRNRENLSLQGNKGDITFISYLFNFDKKLAEEGVFSSYYWTSLVGILPDNINWWHLFIKNDTTRRVSDAQYLTDQINLVNPKHHTHNVLDSVLTMGCVLSIVKDYIRILSKVLLLRDIGHLFKPRDNGISLWYIFNNDWRSSVYGLTAINNLIFLNLFERAMNQLPYQKKGFYLLEGQAWERGLIYAWRKAGHGKLIGVVHSAVSSWDLRHYTPSYIESFSKSLLPVPDMVALNGEGTKIVYEQINDPHNVIFEVEALRYIYLDDLAPVGTNSHFLNKKRMLLLGDSVATVVKTQMDIVSTMLTTCECDVEVLIKPHPLCPIEQADWPEIKITILTSTLSEIVDRYDIAFTSNSTAAAIDVYMAGKHVITLLDPKTFNMSPLKDCSDVEFVVNASDLCQKILAIQINQSNSKRIKYFNTDRSLLMWKKLLEI